jgi:hypothetical protein
MGLPNFLLIGAPKAGTTALHVALSHHPRLYLSPIKEPKYFLTDDSPPQAIGGPGDVRTFRAQVWRRVDYEKLFNAAPAGALRGESTTLYLRDRDAHRRIRAVVPDAKLIAVLRDPVDRAHSNWTHLRSAGLEPESDFVRACDLEPERVAKGWAPFWRYIEQGRYGEQLEHLYTLFPKKQVLVLLYRDYREHQVATVDQVCEFLGVETGRVAAVPAENLTAAPTGSVINVVLQRVVRLADQIDQHLPLPLAHPIKAPATMLLQREQRMRPPLTAGQRELLIPRFAADITLLESVTGRSFSHWLDAGNGIGRATLDRPGRIGTAFRNIDRPPAQRG